MNSFSRLFRKKPIHALQLEASDEKGLKKTLGPIELIALGIGAIIGAGIFFTVGEASSGRLDPITGEILRPGAGPAIILSFVVVAIVCCFAGLCYAEMASMIPISGSAYTYAFATMGEFVAWVIGWDLLLEYAIGNVAVAISWGGYFNAALENLGQLVGSFVGQPGWNWRLPEWLSVCKASASETVIASAPTIYGIPIVFNLLAVVIVLAITWILVIGIKASSRINSVMVIIKLAILFFFIAIGIQFFSIENWFPENANSAWSGFAPNGWNGILTGAAVVFFAYIGFDAVSTVAEESRNPKRDMPIGILGSLGICTVIYIVVAAVLTGMVPYQKLNNPEPLITALEHHSTQIGDSWMRLAKLFVAIGSVIAHTAVLLVFQMGQPRIFFSMSRDGLLPSWCAKVHPKYRTPAGTTIITGLIVAALAAVFPIHEMIEFTNIGTLFAFVLVCGGVLILRMVDPQRERPFRTPWVWMVAPLGMISCSTLMCYLPSNSWARFLVWMLMGLAFYFCMIVWNERLQSRGIRQTTARWISGSVATLLCFVFAMGSVLLGWWKQS